MFNPDKLKVLKPEYELADAIKPMLNVGCLFDIPTGEFLFGKHGEAILNGGLAFLEGAAGKGNSYKSTLIHYKKITAMIRYAFSSCDDYDTELNLHESRLVTFMNNHPENTGENFINTGRWRITDKTKYLGEEWWAIMKEALKVKLKNKKDLLVTTPFLDRDGNNFKMILPSMSGIDSFSEFESADAVAIMDNNELGDAKQNTLHMRQGLIKSNWLKEATRVLIASGYYTTMVAQMGKESEMGGPAKPGGPPTALAALKNGDKLTGVTKRFTYLTHNIWFSYSCKPLHNSSSDRTPKYPKSNRTYGEERDNDLQEITIINLRGKSGPSELPITVIVSQDEGVLPTLSEYHFLRESEFGFVNHSAQHLSLSLIPDLKFQRTTIRGLIDDPANYKIRRAINICSEIRQFFNRSKCDPKYYCTSNELYQDLVDMGYDWDLLLKTRGWWTYDNDQHPIPFLSSFDLLRMRLGEYRPYWMTDDNKGIKPEYCKGQFAS